MLISRQKRPQAHLWRAGGTCVEQCGVARREYPTHTRAYTLRVVCALWVACICNTYTLCLTFAPVLEVALERPHRQQRDDAIRQPRRLLLLLLRGCCNAGRQLRRRLHAATDRGLHFGRHRGLYIGEGTSVKDADVGRRDDGAMSWYGGTAYRVRRMHWVRTGAKSSCRLPSLRRPQLVVERPSTPVKRLWLQVARLLSPPAHQ